MKTIPASEYLAAVTQPKRRKYGNKPVTIDNERFDSQAEARRWGELCTMQRAGLICALRRQPRYELHAYGGDVVGEYCADFEYIVPNEGMRVEDVKSPATAADKLFIWKRRHYEAEYKIHVTLVGKGVQHISEPLERIMTGLVGKVGG